MTHRWLFHPLRLSESLTCRNFRRTTFEDPDTAPRDTRLSGAVTAAPDSIASKGQLDLAQRSDRRPP